MSERNVEPLNDRERACLTHLEEAKKLGLNFSRYCREKDLSFHQWAWVKRALLRKGAISGRHRAEPAKVANFVPVRVAARCRQRRCVGFAILGLDDRVCELSGRVVDVGADVGAAA